MVRLGVDVLFAHRHSLLSGRRVGLVTNYSMTDSRLIPVIDRFLEADDFQLIKLFGPEHGVKNSAKEGEHVNYELDSHSQLPAYSLYGDSKRPTTEMMEDLDVLVIDLQDIGSRYYTNVSTVFLCMQSCAESKVPCVILDRPNPIGGTAREGYPLKSDFASFVGMIPVPHRHGCTMGELARFIKQMYVPDVELDVVGMEGWKRSFLFPDTGLPLTSPSPNTSSFDMMLLYPGTCLFEGTNLSIGRGTTRPFEVVGAPWMDGHKVARWFNDQGLAGVAARPVYFTPFYSQYKGELCEGIQLHITDHRKMHALETGITLLQGIADLYEHDFRFNMPVHHDGKPFFDLLAGDDQLRLHIEAGRGRQYLSNEAQALDQFSKRIQPFELYE